MMRAACHHRDNETKLLPGLAAVYASGLTFGALCVDHSCLFKLAFSSRDCGHTALCSLLVSANFVVFFILITTGLGVV